MTVMPAFRRALALLLLLALAAAFAGCKRDANQVPELQGGEPMDARPVVEGFGLVTAGRGTRPGPAGDRAGLLAAAGRGSRISTTCWWSRDPAARR